MDCSFVGWCALTTNEQAAWVQAVGSIVAIGVAVLVPAVQHGLTISRARRSSELRAKALGLALRPEIDALGDRLNVVWDLENPDEPEGQNPEDRARELGPETVRALAIGPALASQIDVLHEMGEAGEATLCCIHSINRAQELVTTEQHNGLARPITFDAPRFYDFLWDATRNSAIAINKIDAHFKTARRPRVAK